MKSIITEIEWFSGDDVLPPEDEFVRVKGISEICKAVIGEYSYTYWENKDGFYVYGVYYTKLWAFWSEGEDE